VLAWLWLRRPAAFGPLRSALVLATTAANVVFGTWPAAPPRFAVPGMTDILVRYRILGVGSPHGPDSLVNLYAVMPSLHVAWAAWCAAALVAATHGWRRHLAWLYPAATTFVVLATANHFLAAAAGLAVTALGLLAARAATRPDAGPGPGGAVPAVASPGLAGLACHPYLPRPARPGLKPGSAHPTADLGSRTPRTATARPLCGATAPSDRSQRSGRPYHAAFPDPSAGAFRELPRISAGACRHVRQAIAPRGMGDR
jgi:PAP2 superfamily